MRAVKQVPKGAVELLLLEILKTFLDSVPDIEGEPALSWTSESPEVSSDQYFSKVP